MGFGLGSVLSIGGSLLGGLGGNKTSNAAVPQSGYATYDPEIKDYLMDVIFPRITAYGDTGMPQVPLRRANATDYDPVFGSPSRQWLQTYYDQQALPQYQNQPTNETAGNTAVSGLRNEMLAREYIKSLAGSKGYGTLRAENYTPEQMAQMGEAIAAMNPVYSRTAGINFNAGLNSISPELRSQFNDVFSAGRFGASA